MRHGEPIPLELKRQLRRSTLLKSSARDEAFKRVIRSIPSGKVSTYGKVAAAAGYPLYHRAVARLLQTGTALLLPWHRVVGAGGAIKLRLEGEQEQRLRLQQEGVTFNGKAVDMDTCEHIIETEFLDS